MVSTSVIELSANFISVYFSRQDFKARTVLILPKLIEWLR